MSLSNQEMETVLRCVDKVFDFRAERDRLRDILAALEAENKGLAARVAELEARCKRAENDAGWAFSMGAVVHRDEGDWYAVCEGECGSNPSLFAAISKLRSHVEAKP